MSIVKSLFFEQPGHYSVLGIPVTFREEQVPGRTERPIGMVTWLRQGFRRVTYHDHLHTLMHELGHAFAVIGLFWTRPRIWVLSGSRFSRSILHSQFRSAAGVTLWSCPRGSGMWRRFVVSMAGPMSNIAFSTGKIALGRLGLCMAGGYWMTMMCVSFIWSGYWQIYEELTCGAEGDLRGIAYRNGIPAALVARVTLLAQGVGGVLFALRPLAAVVV